MAKEIGNLLRARYPVICVTTFEEERFLAELAEIARSQGRDVYVWNEVNSVRKMVLSVVGDTATSFSESLQGDAYPPNVMAWYEKAPGASVLVFCDLHKHFEQSAVVRTVRNALEMRNYKDPKTIILLSPLPDIPVELKRQVVQIDYPLPNRETISGILSNLQSKMTEEGFAAIVDACRGLTILEIENALAYSQQSSPIPSPPMIIEEKREVIRSSRSLEYYETRAVGMENVGGLDILKEWLAVRRRAFSQEAAEFGLPTPRGVLFVGFPGTGKSLVCKAVASAWQFPLLRFDIGSAFQKYLGESEAEVRNARATAEAIAPCILWLKTSGHNKLCELLEPPESPESHNAGGNAEREGRKIYGIGKRAAKLPMGYYGVVPGRRFRGHPKGVGSKRIRSAQQTLTKGLMT